PGPEDDAQTQARPQLSKYSGTARRAPRRGFGIRSRDQDSERSDLLWLGPLESVRPTRGRSPSRHSLPPAGRIQKSAFPGSAEGNRELRKSAFPDSTCDSGALGGYATRHSQRSAK